MAINVKKINNGIAEGRRTFEIIEEGWLKNLPKLNKYYFKLKDENGGTTTLNYDLSKEGAQNAFSFFVSAVSDWYYNEHRPYDEENAPLVGTIFLADASYTESEKLNPKTEKPYRNLQLNNYQFIQFGSPEREDTECDDIESIDDLLQEDV